MHLLKAMFHEMQERWDGADLLTANLRASLDYEELRADLAHDGAHDCNQKISVIRLLIGTL